VGTLHWINESTKESSVSEQYRIFGVENSPFSVKVRSYFRYKQIPHEWIVRNLTTMPEYQKYAKLPIVPLVVTPDDQPLQDSTPIIDWVEEKHPEPSIHPADEPSRFFSCLIEEFGDEWGNKWMLHYRWAREADQKAASTRLVAEMMPDTPEAQRIETAAGIAERMKGRVWFVGSNEVTASQIEDSWAEGLDLLQAHLADRPFLFGGAPSFGDFGLWGQIYNCGADPTPGEMLRSRAPAVAAWVTRMLEPRSEAGFESWDALAPTLVPFVKRMCGDLFLPWSEANAAALMAGDEEYDVQLDGRTWTQKPVKYQAKSLAAIRARYAAVADKAALDPALAAAGCLAALAK
jgi:glutathione S-transferase